MTTVWDVPAALLEAVNRWKAAGSPEQPPSRWSPAVWQSRLPDEAAYIATLPQPIGRTDVIDRCLDAGSGPGHATRAFITAMIWGYGTVGYGAFRTMRILSENDGSGERLAEAAAIAHDQGGPEAFEWMARRQNRLRFLGVAFATKYLFFCAARSQGQPALVLDRLVRGWMARNAGWQLNGEWDVGSYREYIGQMCGWSEKLSIEPGNLEMVVFQLAANADPQNLWSAPELFASTASESTSAIDETPDASALIEMLDETAATFAALPGRDDPDDLADFRRGIRELKRIVLARS